jgi:amino acid transporter
MSATGQDEPQGGGLRRGAISALGAAVIAMAFMGPATSVFFNTPLGAAHMGYGLPLGTLLALVVCLGVASTVGGFSRRMPTAGFAYTFNTRAFGRGGGFVSGWVLAFAYLAVGPMLFAALGSFGHDFLVDNLSISIPWWVLSLVAIGIVFAIGSRSVDRSVETAIVFLVLEVGVMLTLFITILAKHGSALSLEPFNPGRSLDHFSGIGYGMLWGILMFVGFESAGTLGEETRSAKRSVPLALFAAVGIIGIFYVLSSYAAAIGFGSHGSSAFASDAAPFTTLADSAWGRSVAWIVSLTVINSQLANVISGSNAAVRMMFALGRERILPRRLAQTNAKGSPIGAWTAYIVIAGTLTIGLGAAMGPLNVYGFMGTVLGLGILLVYISINLAFMRWTWVHERTTFSPLRHALIPIVTSLLLLLPIWGQIHPYPAYPVSLVPPIVAALIVSGVGYYLYLRAQAPEVVAGMGRVWGDEDSAPGVTREVAPETAPQVGVV